MRKLAFGMRPQLAVVSTAVIDTHDGLGHAVARALERMDGTLPRVLQWRAPGLYGILARQPARERPRLP